VSCKKKEAADSKESDEYIKPAFISFDDFQNRYEAIPEPCRIQEIGEDPNMIIESNN
jgi:hypothetical protein